MKSVAAGRSAARLQKLYCIRNPGQGNTFIGRAGRSSPAGGAAQVLFDKAWQMG
jgi:hypothetical protein